MKVYLVLVYDDYYPSGDNVKAVYANLKSVPSYEELRKFWGGWQHIEVVEKDLL